MIATSEINSSCLSTIQSGQVISCHGLNRRDRITGIDHGTHGRDILVVVQRVQC